ncbi:MAG: alpha/beta hydrolase [Sphingopyxis sp.]|nr:alpha/beta hydrolase [Sphingopyxis sp.]
MRRFGIAAALLLAVVSPVAAQDVTVSPDGATTFPALTVPNSDLMSAEGNRSRVEHILTERGLKGRSIEDLNAALFGPRLGLMKAAYPDVSIREDRIAGVRVFIYEPKGAKLKLRNRRLLVNLHGGGFVGCFAECGGVESIPIAALTGVPVVSVDYRLAPGARFPAASEDVAAVYGALLKGTPAKRIGLYGCSAGGLLTAQSLAWFQSHGLPAPAAAGIFCAGGDPSMSGDSRYTGLVLGDGEAPRVGPGPAPRLGYMTGTSDDDANAFPAKSPAVLAKFPPTLVITGTRDFGMSSAVNLHSRLVASGVDARLHVWEGGRHAFFYDVRVPESREVYAVVAKFFEDRLK